MGTVHFNRIDRAAAALVLLAAAPLAAAVTPPSGYVYGSQLLGSATQSCVASGPNGTFVGVGPGFTANAQAIVLVRESGASQLVALGFNSIGDCAYDAASDTLYVTDNGGNLTGAATGDTVFRIANASSAVAVPALGAELLPAASIPTAANVAIDAGGDVYVSDSAGYDMGMMPLGSVVKIDLPAVASAPFVTSLGFASGLAVDDATGNLMVAETIATFEAQIRRYDSAGTEVMPIFAAPSYGFGSYDLAYDIDGNLLATGAFGGDVVAFTPAGASSSFIAGLNYANGVSVNPFTGRVEVLSSTFSFPPAAEDRSIHRFTPVSRLVEGGGSADSDCLTEFYGLELVAAAPGDPPKKAICVDGAACDADGEQNDRCTFPVGFCLNVADPDLSGCSTGSSISSFAVATKPFSAAIAAANSAIQAALPAAGPACFFSDGIVVPVKVSAAGKRAGKGKIKVESEAADGRKDADSVSLVCEPAP